MKLNIKRIVRNLRENWKLYLEIMGYLVVVAFLPGIVLGLAVLIWGLPT